MMRERIILTEEYAELAFADCNSASTTVRKYSRTLIKNNGKKLLIQWFESKG